MGPEVKRTNLLVTDDLVGAMDVAEFLKAKGIDAKMVTKHAVQVLPNQKDYAEQMALKYKWGWRMGDKR